MVVRVTGATPQGLIRRLGRRLQGLGRALVIAIPYSWLLAFFLIPFVDRIAVPLAYADNLYHLRLHIDFVRRRFRAEGETDKA